MGLGGATCALHAQAIAGSPHWDLTATVACTASVPGATAYTDLDTLLDQRRDIRVVSICLPPGLRFAAAQTAIRAGRHVMLSQPSRATLSEYHAIEDLARQQRVSIFATWHAREATGVAGAKTWLEGKSIRRVRVTWNAKKAGTGAITQPGGLGVLFGGIDALSILTDILPAPLHVTEAVLEIPDNWQTPIAAKLIFYHPRCKEVVAHFDMRHAGAPVQTISIETDQGRLALVDAGAGLRIDDVSVLTQPDLGRGAEFSRLYTHLAHLVAHGDSDMDLSPLRHVADAFILGRRTTVAGFHG